MQAVTVLCDIQLGTEGLHGQEVRVITAATDDVTPRQAELHLLVACEEWTREEERSANLTSELRRHLGRAQRARDTNGARVELLHHRPVGGRDFEHGPHIADPRHIPQSDGVVSQKTRCDEW